MTDKIFLVKEREKYNPEVRASNQIWLELTPEELELIKDRILLFPCDYKKLKLKENLLKKLESLTGEKT